METNTNSSWFKNRQNLLYLALVLTLLVGGIFWYQRDGGSKFGLNQNATSTDESSGLSADDAVPSSTSKTTTSSGGSSATSYPKYDVDGATLVYYDNSGFHPKNLQIAEKTTVRFVNKSSKAMRIFATDRTISKYTSLDQSSSISKGEYYNYVFIGKGVWAYNNKNYPSDEGSVLVF